MNWKLTAATLICTLGIANSAIAVPVEQIDQWFTISQKAVSHSDYDTAIINYRRIINNTSEGCAIEYYARWLQAAQEAKAILKVGGNPDAAFQLYANHATEIQSDQNLGCVWK